MTVDSHGRLAREIGWPAAGAVVIANMVGAGIFTTSGFMARALGSPLEIFALWIAGGMFAIVGALAYAELGAALPEAGGEYVFLREAYGPLAGFLSGWTSFLAGFSGAIAAGLFGFAGYCDRLAPWIVNLAGGPRTFALAVLWTLTAVHALGAGPGSRVQATLTAATVAAIAAIVAAGFGAGHGSLANFAAAAPARGNIAISLIFVLYAYSGWNAAAYLAGEIRAPARGVPLALLCGTAVVIALYLALNAVFLYALPVARMAGVLAIGEAAARALFGRGMARTVAAVIALAILSSTSAMVMVGPRVYYAMARDGAAPGALAATDTRSAAPARAILAQSAWTSVLIIFFGAFEPIVVYTGFAVAVFSAAAVAAVIVMRVKRPRMARPFKMPGYPWLALLYLAASAWIAVYTIAAQPREALIGIGAVGAGAPVYLLARGLCRKRARSSESFKADGSK
jgi:APA family basic amino acid/polyamine antiporter